MARIRSITTGTAVAASVATAGFGGLAALTYSGTTLGSSDTTVPGAVGGTTTTTNNTKTNTGTTPVGLQPTAAPVISTRKHQVTSGGSGG